MHSVAKFLLVLAALMGHLIPARACCFSMSEQPQEMACCTQHQEVRTPAKKSCCHIVDQESKQVEQTQTVPLPQTPECCCSQGSQPATVPQESQRTVAVADISLPTTEFHCVAAPQLNVEAAPACSHPRGLQKLLCRWLC